MLRGWRSERKAATLEKKQAKQDQFFGLGVGEPARVFIHKAIEWIERNEGMAHLPPIFLTL